MGSRISRYIPRAVTEEYEVVAPMGRVERWETHLIERRSDGEPFVLRIDRDAPSNPRERRCVEESYVRIRRIRHPSLPRVERMGFLHSKGHYLITRFASGTNLINMSRHLDYPAIVDILIKLLPAMHVLHLSQVTHARISPKKIIVEGLDENRKVRLVDIGCSSNEDGRRWCPEPYRAPEQFQQGRPDGRTDLYGLAVTMFEVITKRSPFTNRSRGALWALGEGQEVPPIRVTHEECPYALDDLIMRMGSRDREARPRNALVAAQELRQTRMTSPNLTTLDPQLLIENSRWLTTRNRAKMILSEFAKEPLPTQVTAEKGLERVAEEIRIHAELRQPKKIIHLLPRDPSADPQQEPKTYTKCPTIKLNLIHPPKRRRPWKRFSEAAHETKINKTHETRTDGHTEYTIEVNPHPTEPDLRRWLLAFCLGPIDQRRLRALCPWIRWRFEGNEDQMARYIQHKIVFTEGHPRLNWPKIGQDIVDSLPTEDQRYPPLGATTFPARTVTENSKYLRWAVLPREGATLMSRRRYTNQRGTQQKQRQRKEIRELMILAGYRCKGKTTAEQKNATNTKRGGADGGVGRQEDQGRSTNEENGKQVAITCKPRNIPEILGPIESTPSIEFVMERRRTLHREQTTAVRRALAERNWHLARTIAEKIERRLESQVSARGRQETYLYIGAAALGEGDERTAKHYNVKAASEALKDGDLRTARLAIVNLALTATMLGQSANVHYWKLAAATPGEQTLQSTPKRASNDTALFYRLRRYRAAIRVGVSSMRKERNSDKEWPRRNLCHNIALAYLRIGRPGRALKWIRRMKEGDVEKTSTLLLNLEIGVKLGCRELVKETVSLLSQRDKLHGSADSELAAGWINLVSPRLLSRERETVKEVKGGGSVTQVESDILNVLEKTKRQNAVGGRGWLDLLDQAGRINREVLWAAGRDSTRRLIELIECAQALSARGELELATRLASLGAARSRGLGLYDSTVRFLAMARVWSARNREVALSERHRSGLRKFLLTELQVGAEEWRQRTQMRIKRLERVLAELGERPDQVQHMNSEPSVARWSNKCALLQAEHGGEVIAYTGKNGSRSVLCWDGTGSGKVWRSAATIERIGEAGNGTRSFVWRTREGRASAAYACSNEGKWSLISVYDSESSEVSTGRLRALAKEIANWNRLSHIGVDGSSAKSIHTWASNTRQSCATDGPTRIRIGERHLCVASKEMQSVLSRIDRLAKRGVSLCLIGESGVGKDLLAEYAHMQSPMSKGRFIPIDCPGLSSSLAEAELFGYDKGAFSGAVESRDGLIRAAHKGSLFLDEIADMNMRVQSKMLRVLSSRRVRRIGSNVASISDFYLISATNGDIRQLAENDRFRLDLLYRLGVVTVVPPLRDRISDIPHLWDWFMRLHGANGNMVAYESAVLSVLLDYSWPGNIREMSNVAHASVAMRDGDIVDSALVEGILSKGRIKRDRNSSSLVKEEGTEAIESLMRRRGAIARRHVVSELGVSERTALRLLQGMVQSGKAMRCGRGRGVSYRLSGCGGWDVTPG